MNYRLKPKFCCYLLIVILVVDHFPPDLFSNFYQMFMFVEPTVKNVCVKTVTRFQTLHEHLLPSRYVSMLIQPTHFTLIHTKMGCHLTILFQNRTYNMTKKVMCGKIRIELVAG